MSKRLKLLWVTSAAIAFCAASAAQASAASFHFVITPAWVKAIQETQIVTTVSGGTIKCSSFELKSSAAISTVSVSTIEMHPILTGCSAFGQSVTVTTTGCSETFGLSSATAGTMSISCVEGSTINVHGSTTGCSVSIGGIQTFPNGVGYTSSSTGTKVVLITFSVTGMVYTASGGACGASGSNGTESGSALAKAFRSAAFSEQQGMNTE